MGKNELAWGFEIDVIQESAEDVKKSIATTKNVSYLIIVKSVSVYSDMSKESNYIYALLNWILQIKIGIKRWLSARGKVSLCEATHYHWIKNYK